MNVLLAIRLSERIKSFSSFLDDYQLHLFPQKQIKKLKKHICSKNSAKLLKKFRILNRINLWILFYH